MKSIAAEIIEKTWLEVTQMDFSTAPSVIKTIQNQQPHILAYLMGSGSDLFNEEEKQLILYVGLVIWKVMSKGNKSLAVISQAELENAEAANLEVLDQLEDKFGDEFINKVDELFSHYNQADLLGYVIEALLGNAEEINDIRDENIGIMMIYLKTVIDCFDK